MEALNTHGSGTGHLSFAESLAMKLIFDPLLAYSFLFACNPKLPAPKTWEDMREAGQRESSLVGASVLNMNKPWYNELRI